jgi:hypothetical protein
MHMRRKHEQIGPNLRREDAAPDEIIERIAYAVLKTSV